MEALNNPDRVLLFNIVDQTMPADLRFILRQRRDANDIIHNAINQIVQENQDNPDDVYDVNPPPLIREGPRVTVLDRIYNNIRTLLGQPQGPQGLQGQPGPLREEEEVDKGGSIDPPPPPFGGKLRKTSKKRPTARRRSSKARRSSKSRKSRTTRRR